MRTPFRGQSQDQVTTKLPVLSTALPESASRQPTMRVQDNLLKRWWALQGSNPQPSDYASGQKAASRG